MDRALTQDSAGCSGRSVVVRGQAVRSLTWQAPDSLVQQSALVDGTGPAGALPLGLTWVRPNPLLAALRRWPLLGRVVPPPQHLHMGMPALYRVQLWVPAGGNARVRWGDTQIRTGPEGTAGCCAWAAVL